MMTDHKIGPKKGRMIFIQAKNTNASTASAAIVSR
jgi:hypothetical protein